MKAEGPTYLMLSWFKKLIGQNSPAELPVESSSDPIPNAEGNPGRSSKLTLSVTGPSGSALKNIEFVQTLSGVLL